MIPAKATPLFKPTFFDLSRASIPRTNPTMEQTKVTGHPKTKRHEKGIATIPSTKEAIEKFLKELQRKYEFITKEK